MGTKRVGLARVQKLIENLKRDLDLTGTRLTGQKRLVEALTNTAAVTRTLLASESGKLFTVSTAATDNDITLTLPAASTSAGVEYEFAYQANSDDDADLVITTGDNDVDIFGGIITLAANNTVDAFNGVSKITVDNSVAQSTEGLYFRLLCDGANWHLSGHIATAVGTVHLVGAAGA